MRGFTMLLVVYSHVMGFCLGDRSMGFNDVFFLFRLPCFFFISGWLFYKPYEPTDFKPIVRKKFMVQIIPTFIFLLLLAPPPLFFSRLGALKGGYWFTFALFEFFVIYLSTSLLLRKCRQRDGLMLLMAFGISVTAFAYDVCYNGIDHQLGWLKDVLGALSFMTWRYYLFFFLGTLAKKHFKLFLCFTNKKSVIAIVITGFIAIALLPHTDLAILEYTRFAIGGILGMTTVFTFFRTFSSWFAKEKPIGNALQVIGTRTLDIYLLHYFFLPRFLLPIGERLNAVGSSVMELTVGLFLASIVTAICLLVSHIVRLSPFLAHYLFGAKKE